jgi:hypothetical protein
MWMIQIGISSSTSKAFAKGELILLDMKNIFDADGLSEAAGF